MAKYLSIPVTNEQNQIVLADGVILVEQASTTTVTMTYGGGKVVTITHATQGAGVETTRDQIQAAIVSGFQKNWQNVTTTVAPTYAISGIAIA